MCSVLECVCVTDVAFVHVLFACAPLVPRRAVTLEHAVDGVGVALGPTPAGVTDARIIHVAQQPWTD